MAVVILIILGVLSVAGWVFANRVLVPAPYALNPEFTLGGVESGGAGGLPPDLPEPLQSRARSGATVTVSLPEPEPGRQHANTRAEGVYGLLWEGGHGLLGPVTTDGGLLKREVHLLAGHLPGSEMAARVDNFVYRQDPHADLGLQYEELTLDGEAGQLRAWFVPGEDDATAVLLLHGRRRGELTELLRFTEVFNGLGLPALALAYRNHDQSAPSKDGYYHYGASEWRDALVGAEELRERGFKRVVVFGASMGGAVALEAVKRWPAEAPAVVGMILDSPLVDPYPVIQSGAERMGVPQAALMTRLALLIAGLRTGVSFRSLRQHLTGAQLTQPLLLIAGVADATVPISAIDRFVAARAAPLQYVRLEGVEHVEAWNINPALYRERVREFLASL